MAVARGGVWLRTAASAVRRHRTLATSGTEPSRSLFPLLLSFLSLSLSVILSFFCFSFSLSLVLFLPLFPFCFFSCLLLSFLCFFSVSLFFFLSFFSLSSLLCVTVLFLLSLSFVQQLRLACYSFSSSPSVVVFPMVILCVSSFLPVCHFSLLVLFLSLYAITGMCYFSALCLLLLHVFLDVRSSLNRYATHLCLGQSWRSSPSSIGGTNAALVSASLIRTVLPPLW